MAQQYLITAYDFTDSEALNRRLAARPAHLESIKKYKDSGHFIIGGAILDADGRMIGSSLIMAFDTEAELQNWLVQDPYKMQGVWDAIEIKPFRVAAV